MLENAVRRNPTVTLDDLRRDVRLGMGPCQGGFCTYRAVGILHEMRAAGETGPQEQAAPPCGAEWDVAFLQSPARSENVAPVRAGTVPDPAPSGTASQVSAAIDPEATVSHPNLLLRDFLQERWKGVAPILWGQQLRQERLDELIYLSIFNADHLPGQHEESPMSAFYRQISED